MPAAPRYGHSLVLLPGTQGQELLILGGCATSPSQADGRSSDGDEDQDAVDLELSLSAQRVAHAYALEVATAKAAAAALRADALATGHANVVRDHHERCAIRLNMFRIDEVNERILFSLDIFYKCATFQRDYSITNSFFPSLFLLRICLSLPSHSK